MSTATLTAINILSLLAGGDVRPMAKHRAKPTTNHTSVPAPRCPHGHFKRWATRNCKECK